MIAQIFSIGTEILLGNIVDTNSQYLAKKMSDFGYNVFKMETVGDNKERLFDAFKSCDGKVDYVISSGGLGPTPDDISKEVAVKVCGLEDEQEVHQESYEYLKNYFANNKKSIETNIKQVIFPKSAIVLPNPKGTAPGCILTSRLGTKFILLPGPPNEMTYMFENEVEKHLEKFNIIKSVTAQIGILGEWDMASRIDLDRDHPTISPYVKKSGPTLRITSMGKKIDDVDQELELGKELVRKSLGPYLITFDDIRKEKVLINILKDRNEKFSTAESITGGLIASSIIDIPGASDVIEESYITYSNDVKEKILNVSRETIKEYTVVSREVVLEMLNGLYQKTKSNLCLATTGYAHTGEVYIGILYNQKPYVRHLQLNGDRNMVRQRVENQIIDTAILILRGDYENNIDF